MRMMTTTSTKLVFNFILFLALHFFIFDARSLIVSNFSDEVIELVDLTLRKQSNSDWIKACPHDGKRYVPVSYRFPSVKRLFSNYSLDEYFDTNLNNIYPIIEALSQIPNSLMNSNFNSRTMASIVELSNVFNGGGLCLKPSYSGKEPIFWQDSKYDFRPFQDLCYSNFPLANMWTEPICLPYASSIVLTKIIPIFSFDNHRFTNKSFLFLNMDLKSAPLDLCRIEMHSCNPDSSQCLYRRVQKFNFDINNYYCKCRNGFYRNSDAQINNSDPYSSLSPSDPHVAVSNIQLPGNITDGPNQDQCLPCQPGCTSCTSNNSCRIPFKLTFIRGLCLGVQSFCITLCIVFCGIIFRVRQARVIEASTWTLLVIFLIGVVLLYSSVVVRHLQSSNTNCILLPWFRELGFAITYGTLLVKVYRVLTGFQSRKAHRVYVRDRDLLRYLGALIAVAVGYMSMWTAATLDHHYGVAKSSLLEEVTLDDLQFMTCRARYWDIVVEVAEFMILLLGIYYCYCSRSAPCEYNEMRFITISIINEAVVSAVVHIVKHIVWQRVLPEYISLIYFIRCQLTVTVTVILNVGVKFWYLYKPPPTVNRARAIVHVDAPLCAPSKFNLVCNGEVDMGETSLADMHTEEIRRELKRLRTQLETFKAKAHCKESQHPKRQRSIRKQRRFSIQPFTRNKLSLPSTSVHEEEASRISEDSSNSGDELRGNK